MLLCAEQAELLEAERARRLAADVANGRLKQVNARLEEANAGLKDALLKDAMLRSGGGGAAVPSACNTCNTRSQRSLQHSRHLQPIEPAAAAASAAAAAAACGRGMIEGSVVPGVVTPGWAVVD